MEKEKEFDPLLLGNQLCFPLYAAARKIVAAYTPFLRQIGLTYAQYVTMMVMWEDREITMRDLGKRLFLDSGTLTPVLKRLEALGYVRRQRNAEDERLLTVRITDEGLALKEKALSVPCAMGCLLNQHGQILTREEVSDMKEQLYRIISALQ